MVNRVTRFHPTASHFCRLRPKSVALRPTSVSFVPSRPASKRHSRNSWGVVERSADPRGIAGRCWGFADRASMVSAEHTLYRVFMPLRIASNIHGAPLQTYSTRDELEWDTKPRAIALQVQTRIVFLAIQHGSRKNRQRFAPIDPQSAVELVAEAKKSVAGRKLASVKPEEWAAAKATADLGPPLPA